MRKKRVAYLPFFADYASNVHQPMKKFRTQGGHYTVISPERVESVQRVLALWLVEQAPWAS